MHDVSTSTKISRISGRVKATLIGLAMAGTMAPAAAVPVTYSFDYHVTSARMGDGYASLWKGSTLLQEGARGTGQLTFEYQPESASTIMNAGINTVYDSLPFSLRLASNSQTLTLIDSAVFGYQWQRRGIIVQNVPDTSSVYDTVLVEGLSGAVSATNAAGLPMIEQFHAQLGLMAASNALSGLDLSNSNIDAMLRAPISTYLSIDSLDTNFMGGAYALISDFKREPAISTVPEPSSLMLLAIGALAFIGRTKRPLGQPSRAR